MDELMLYVDADAGQDVTYSEPKGIVWNETATGRVWIMPRHFHLWHADGNTAGNVTPEPATQKLA